MDGTGGSALGFPLGSGVLLHSVKLDVWETSRPCARRPASKATGKGSHPVHSVQLAVSGTWPRLAQDGAQRGSSQECPSLRFTGAHLQPPPSSPGAVASAGVGGVAGRRGVLGSVGHREPSRGSDHPQAPVGMPRPHCSPRAPPPSEACPQAGARRPSGHSFRQELQAPLRLPSLHTGDSLGQTTLLKLGQPCPGGGQVGSQSGQACGFFPRGWACRCKHVGQKP